MTTPRDLFIVALDVGQPSRPVESGDLSLALAGAELIDLLKLPAGRLDDGRIVPGRLPAPTDRILEEAAASFVRQEPFESVSDWLWRRGNSLAGKYLAALEAEGAVVPQGKHHFRGGRKVLADSPSRRHAAERWAASEPVLVALAESLGVRGEQQTGDRPDDVDHVVATVVAGVNDALLELEAERQRRGVEQAAFDNIWRGLE
ncbi:GPP34 family phosphoprotein [Streptomyces sp. NPDC006283]|uniref:GOLPH3/VPS74 family protein n=1 Tax=Streptomyces sp. NPDC006283 TaxID=3156741 RepID=UPI0033A6FDDA